MMPTLIIAKYKVLYIKLIKSGILERFSVKEIFEETNIFGRIIYFKINLFLKQAYLD